MIIKDSPQDVKEMISISVIKLILNTCVIKKRIYKKKRKARKVSKIIKEIMNILPEVHQGLGQR